MYVGHQRTRELYIHVAASRESMLCGAFPRGRGIVIRRFHAAVFGHNCRPVVGIAHFISSEKGAQPVWFTAVAERVNRSCA